MRTAGRRVFRGTDLSANHHFEGGLTGQQSLTRWDERRRIARELHDSTSQLLVLLQLQLRRLSDCGHPKAESIIEECRHTIDDIREQIRGLNLD